MAYCTTTLPRVPPFDHVIVRAAESRAKASFWVFVPDQSVFCHRTPLRDLRLQAPSFMHRSRILATPLLEQKLYRISSLQYLCMHA